MLAASNRLYGLRVMGGWASLGVMLVSARANGNSFILHDCLFSHPDSIPHFVYSVKFQRFYLQITPVMLSYSYFF